MLVVSKRSFQRTPFMSGEAVLRGPPKDPMWAFRSPPIMQGPRVRDDISSCSRSSKQDLYSAMGWPASGIYAQIIVSCFVVSEASVILMARNLSLLMFSTGVTHILDHLQKVLSVGPFLLGRCAEDSNSPTSRVNLGRVTTSSTAFLWTVLRSWLFKAPLSPLASFQLLYPRKTNAESSFQRFSSSLSSSP